MPRQKRSKEASKRAGRISRIKGSSLYDFSYLLRYLGKKGLGERSLKKIDDILTGKVDIKRLRESIVYAVEEQLKRLSISELYELKKRCEKAGAMELYKVVNNVYEEKRKEAEEKRKLSNLSLKRGLLGK